jgi:hypothetical protein
MTGTEPRPFFEREDHGTTSLPAERYVAGIRSSDDDGPTVRMILPAEIVDRSVLTGAQLSVWLSAGSGRLILDGKGVDNDSLEAALDAGPMREQTLLTLITACIDPDHLAMEEDPVGDLTSLRGQIVVRNGCGRPGSENGQPSNAAVECQPTAVQNGADLAVR